MALRQTLMDDIVPEPGYTRNAHMSVDSGSTRLRNRSQNPIRGQEIYLSTTIVAVPPRNASETENVISLHPSVQRIQNHSATNHHQTLEIQRNNMNLDTYEGRLGTFNGWPVPFLAAEVLSEAQFCYTGYGDIVKCVKCGGELSHWRRGDDPTEEHLLCFGFLCNT